MLITSKFTPASFLHGLGCQAQMFDRGPVELEF